jgi:hypothetical protein
MRLGIHLRHVVPPPPHLDRALITPGGQRFRRHVDRAARLAIAGDSKARPHARSAQPPRRLHELADAFRPQQPPGIQHYRRAVRLWLRLELGHVHT